MDKHFRVAYSCCSIPKKASLVLVQITLIDQNERFVFKPLLYELLTDRAGDMDVAPTFSKLLAGTSVTFKQVCVGTR